MKRQTSYQLADDGCILYRGWHIAIELWSLLDEVLYEIDWMLRRRYER